MQKKEKVESTQYVSPGAPREPEEEAITEQKGDRVVDHYKAIKETCAFLVKRCPDIKKCKTAMVLGSGLGGFVENLEEPTQAIPYKEIPNWKCSTAMGHKSQLVVGHLKGDENTWLVFMQGRLHCYEGYSAKDVSFPVRIFGYLGINNIVLTAAAGSLNPEYDLSEIVLIKDHINQMGVSPLVGNPFEPMFVDMSDCYTRKLREKFMEIAYKHKVKVEQGVYVAQIGPAFETRAEYKYYQLIGGDTMGMSVIPENLVATQLGMNCLGIAVVGNKGLNLIGHPPMHSSVLKYVSRALPNIAKVLLDLLPTLE